MFAIKLHAGISGCIRMAHMHGCTCMFAHIPVHVSYVCPELITSNIMTSTSTSSYF